MSCSGMCKGFTTKALPVKAGVLSLCVCSVDWRAFANGPGAVHLDIDEQLNSLKHPDVPYTTLVFRAGDMNGLNETAAWSVEASVGIDYPNGPASAYDQWQVGFIQTVETLVWEATYADNWNRKVMAGGSRDTGDPTTTPPWYGPAGSLGEPFGVTKLNKSHPALSDDPTMSLLVAHPDAPCKQLSRVTVKGTFHVFLVARDSAGPLSVDRLKFLWHSSIDVDKAWDLKFGEDPFGLWNWTGSGTQSRSNDGFGKGAKTPILDNPIANIQLRNIATEKKGSPCPPTPTPKSK